jgi:hypothetical protein
MAIDALGSIVFMKVGRHAGETFEQILERKRREFERTGKVFWGYGGGTMHPTQRVQPFARMRVEHGEKISIVMEPIDSRHPDTQVFATEFSRDGILWEPIPDGIQVRGSRYALVLDEIHEGDLSIDLGEYVVGAGPSEGRLGTHYIKGRVDKGCLVHTGHPAPVGESRVVKVQYAATLGDPYAVLLR